MIIIHRLFLVLVIASFLVSATTAEAQSPPTNNSLTNNEVKEKPIVINGQIKNGEGNETDSKNIVKEPPKEEAKVPVVTASVVAQNKSIQDDPLQQQNSPFGQELTLKEAQAPKSENSKPSNSEEFDLDYHENEASTLSTLPQKNQNKVDLASKPFSSQEGETVIHNQAEIEEQKEVEWQLSNKEGLNEWIAEELENNVVIEEGIVMQSFQAYIDPGKSFNFRWNPPKSQTLHIKVMAFELLDDGALMVLQNNEKDQNIQISYRDEGKAFYTILGQVYIQRTFKFNFDTDLKYFRMTNNANKGILVMVDLQRLQEVINIKEAVKNDNFSLAVKKLQVIHDDVVSGQKLREHSYKYQWGFLDNQYAHDTRLLGLTGLQLLVIIAAALIQIYFIKNLLDNRAVV